MGLCGFYRQFVSGFPRHAAPFIDLMKKGAFVWTPEARDRFEKFKHLMTSCPVLTLVDFTRPFELQCNAFG